MGIVRSVELTPKINRFVLLQKEDFEKAAADVKTLTKQPSNEELLEIYGLYKQATAGDNGTRITKKIKFTY
jgi:acyl-CoA-binding protein